mgnify:CR=1 FL=1
MRIADQKKLAPYIFLGPFILLFLVFGLYPIGYSIFISFFKWTANGREEFRGISNYVKLFTTDPFFLKSLGNTIWLMFWGSFLQHFFAIPLAIALNNKARRGRNIFRTAYFLPYITSSVSITIIFALIFDHNYGWLNYLITNLFNGTSINWLQDPAYIKPSLAILLNWRYIGWNVVIYVAGLQSIPGELYEAATVDGANRFQQHMRITLPLLIPVIFFAMTMSIIGGMQVFEEPFLLTKGYTAMGGTDNAGLTSALYLMFNGFKAGRYGKGSAIAWTLFLFIILFTALNRYITQKMKNR